MEDGGRATPRPGRHQHILRKPSLRMQFRTLNLLPDYMYRTFLSHTQPAGSLPLSTVAKRAAGIRQRTFHKLANTKYRKIDHDIMQAEGLYLPRTRLVQPTCSNTSTHAQPDSRGWDSCNSLDAVGDARQTGAASSTNRCSQFDRQRNPA